MAFGIHRIPFQLLLALCRAVGRLGLTLFKNGRDGGCRLLLVGTRSLLSNRSGRWCRGLRRFKALVLGRLLSVVTMAVSNRSH